MLKRLYIDNYKCCENFEIKFDAINLCLGENGAGKSTIFEVLQLLRDFIVPPTDFKRLKSVSQLLPETSKTRWKDSVHQKFEFDIESPDGLYQYSLSLEHLHDSGHRVLIREESLKLDDRSLVSTKGNTGHFTTGDNEVWVDLNVIDDSRSIFTQLFLVDIELQQFVKQLERFTFLKINPHIMRSEGIGESKHLSNDGSNFVAWYKYLSRDQQFTLDVTARLKDAMEDFSHFYFAPFSESRHQLRVYFADRWYRFGELSEGQRVAILLHVLHVYFEQDTGRNILCIDEPGNYLALREIQPFLSDWSIAAEDRDIQALIISHHPEAINYLASSSGIWFKRSGQNEPIVIKKFAVEAHSLSLSQWVARGWIE